MEQKEPEIINIVFGSAAIYLPNSKEWIAKVRKLLDLLEEGVIGAGKENTVQSLPLQSEAIFKLIPNFKWDKSKEKSYRTIFFVEEEDGRVGISYFNSKIFTTKEAVMSIPFPMPYGYTPLKSFSSNRKTAIRLYREYLFNEARNAEVQGAVKRDEEQEEKDAAEKREEELRKKAEINKKRWESKQKQEPKEMSARTKELRDNVVAKMEYHG